MNWENYVSDDTMKMLEAVIKKRMKHQKLKQKKGNFLLLFTGMVILLLTYLYYLFSNSNTVGLDTFHALTYVMGNSIMFVILISTMYVYYRYLAIAKKEKKEKDKYNKLRAEVIHYLDKHYLSPYNNIREEISKSMEEKYKINLRYKSD